MPQLLHLTQLLTEVQVFFFFCPSRVKKKILQGDQGAPPLIAFVFVCQCLLTGHFWKTYCGMQRNKHKGILEEIHLKQGS